VTNTQTAYLAGDKNDFRLRALEKFATLADQASPSGPPTDAQNRSPPPPGVANMVDKWARFNPDEIDSFLAKFPSVGTASSVRLDQPISDLHSNDMGLSTSFPHIFLLGKAYGRCPGRLTPRQRCHLLHQFHLTPASDRRLLGYLFDVMQRFKVFDGVRAYVNDNRKAIADIAKLLQDKEERLQLHKAIRAPTSSLEHKTLLKKYLNHLRLVGKEVSYGNVEASTLRHRILGLNNRFSAPTCFLTLSPTNLDNPRSIRMSFSTRSNSKFPSCFSANGGHGATPSEFLQHCENGYTTVSAGDIHLPRAARARLAMANPVAFVQENKTLLTDIITILIGLPMESKGFHSKLENSSHRASVYYMWRRKGILGHPLYLSGVTEDHARGTLHYHLNISAGLPPYVFQRFANIEELCPLISAYLDTVYSSTIAPDDHIAGMVRETLQQNQVGWSLPYQLLQSTRFRDYLLRRPKEIQTLKQSLALRNQSTRARIEAHLAHEKGSEQRHAHHATCKKGRHGKTGCRFCMPCETLEKTGAVQLKLKSPSAPPPPSSPPPAMCTPLPYDPPPLHASGFPLPASDVAAMVLPPATPPPLGSTCAPPADDTTATSSTEFDPAEPCYDIVPLPDGSTPSDHSYRLQNILGREPLTGAVMWETARPRIDHHRILDTPFNILSIRNDLHEFLAPVPGFEVSNVTFWNWIDETATQEQLFTLLRDIQRGLPPSNGTVVTHSPVLTFCTCSHNNASPLGSLDQARSAMFYLIPYEGKDKFPLAHCLTILNHSLQHVKLHKSTHPTETGTLLRTVKQMLQRTVNQIHLHIELSDYQTAAALLELPSMVMSEKFAYGNPWTITTFADCIAKMERAGTSPPLPDRRLLADSAVPTPQRCALVALQQQLEDKKETFASFDTSAFSVEAGEEENGDPNQAVVDDQVPLPPGLSLCDGMGHIRKLVINKGSRNPDVPEETLLVPQAALYHHRSPLLHDLSFYEFLACIQLRPGKPKPPDQPGKTSKASHVQFELGNDFIGRGDYHHLIRQKQVTPLITGRKPPFPGAEPDPSNKKAHAAWKLKSNDFAKYYLSLFRPYVPNSDLSFLWDDLCCWITDLQDDTSVISKFRLMVMDNHVQGLRTNETISSIIRDYRSRHRRLWTEAEIAKEASQKASCRTQRFPHDLFDPLSCSSERKSLTLSSLHSCQKQCQHDTAQAAQLCSTMGIGFAASQTAHGSFALSPTRAPQCARGTRMRQKFISTLSSSLVEQRIATLKTWQPPDAPSHSQPGEDARPPLAHVQQKAAIAKIRKALEHKDNHEQLQLFDQYAAHFLDEKDGNRLPQMVLLHGGPGVGKSKLRDAICEAAAAVGRHVFKTAFNAINAVEMGGGTSSAELQLRPEVHYRDSGNFQSGRVQELRMEGFNRKSLVVVEEVSNQAPWHLARLHTLCQSVIENANHSASKSIGTPFGGALVLLIGDLTQLGPVKAGPSLTESILDVHGDPSSKARLSRATTKRKSKKKSLIPSADGSDSKYVATTPYMVGTNLFTYCRWYELSQQLRSEDPHHSKFVTDSYRGNPITLQTIRDHNYAILSRQDNEDPEWVRAPVLVATNRERHTLSHVRAVNFATHHNTVVIRWLNNFSDNSWIQKPQGVNLNFAMEDPCFHEYFVAGADAFMTDNLQKKLGLVNARSVIFHSLKFDDDGERYLRHALRSASPGDVITMPKPPVSVNVLVQLEPGIPSSVRQALRSLSLPGAPKSTALLPIYKSKSGRSDSQPTTVYGGDGFHPSKVVLRRFFPVEPAFAITVHKAEGRTMPRVIIALSHHPVAACNFSHAQVHVAFSRVRQGRHIRLLLTGESEVEKWLSLTYLGKLRPHPSIQFFFNGFKRSLPPHQSHLDWRTTAWSAKDANHHSCR